RRNRAFVVGPHGGPTSGQSGELDGGRTMTARPIRLRYISVLACTLGALVAMLVYGEREAEAQPVAPPGVQFPQGRRAQPQLSMIPAQGPRGPIMLGNTPAGLTMPMGPGGVGFSRRTGLQLSVKTEWPGQYGYRPITVTVRSEKPATSDRNVEFRFT